MKRVYAFGTFDGIHPGHRSFLRQAKGLGEHLTVIVARDANARRHGKSPVRHEDDRRQDVQDLGIADEVKLGDTSQSYRLLASEPIDVLCLGYDQWCDDNVHALLARVGRTDIKVERARGYFPWLFRSRYLRRLGLVRPKPEPGNVDNPPGN